jgi:predicted small lipoprotein YifL
MRSVLLTSCLLLLAGCGTSGPATYPVKGTASFEGRPIPEGDIQFIPENPEQRAEGGRIVDGKFTFEATAGKKRVEITASRADPVLKGPKGEPTFVDYIPAQFNTQSTLTADVNAGGPNEFKFELDAR